MASYFVAIFPFVYYANKNILLVGSREVWITLGFVSLHWLVLFLVNLLLFRKLGKASLAAIVMVLPISGFHPGLELLNRIGSFQYGKIEVPR